MKTTLIFTICILVLLTGCSNDQMVGNDKDEHGCIGSAGYSWCEAKQKCLRTWEENCPAANIQTFEECVAAGNPVMESYPRQCAANGKTFTEKIEHICTEQESLATACTLEYNPVCGKLILNSGETTYQTFGNGCSACSTMKVVSYTLGEC